MEMETVIVVGGGLAGLAAAKQLAEAGLTVTVVEKRAPLGGKWAAWRDADGDWIETGLHVFFGAYDEIFTLMQELGSYQAIDWKAHRMHFTLAGGEQYELTFAPLPGFLSTAPTLLDNRFFSLAQKWSLIRAGLPLFLGGQGYVDGVDALSYEAWHQQHGIHDRILQKMFLPVSLATKFVPPDALSAKLVIEVSRLLMGRFGNARIGFLRGSPEVYLTGPLAARVEAAGGVIRRNVRATRIELAPDGRAAALHGTGPAGAERLPCDALLLALPIHNLQRLLPDRWRTLPYFAGLMQLEGAPVITLHLWLDRVVGGIDHLLFSPDGIFPVYADMARTTPDYATVGSRFQFVLAPAANLMPLSDEALVTRAMADLRRLFPHEAAEARVRKQVVVRLPQSVYWPRPGTDRYRVLQASPLPNVFLAGGYTLQRFYDSMEGAVRSGHRAAEALLARRAGRPWLHRM